MYTMYKIPIINSMLILTLLILWPISLFTILPSPTVLPVLPYQIPHSHSFALLVHQSLDDGTIPNSIVEIGLALELLPLSPLIAIRMLLKRLNRNRVRIYCITCEYSSFLFKAISCAILLWCFGFWTSPSSSGKDNGCEGSMLYVQDTFSVTSFFNVLVVYVCILPAHVDVRSTVGVKNFYI